MDILAIKKWTRIILAAGNNRLSENSCKNYNFFRFSMNINCSLKQQGSERHRKLNCFLGDMNSNVNERLAFSFYI